MRFLAVSCLWLLLQPIASLPAAEVVLYDFYADWCGPCRSMAPIIARLEAEGTTVRRVNVDRHPELARRFAVRELPTFVVVADGQERGRLVGAVSEERLRALLRSARAGSSKPAGARSAVGSRRADLYRYLLEVSVRMYRETGGARYYGSGTIISATDTEAIVLTCAHLFRSSSGLGQTVMVEWFGTEPPRTYRGRLIARDRNADLALVRIQTDRRLPAARVGTEGMRLQPGTTLFSVGCDRGSRPRIYPTRLTAVNRYVGAPNFEILGAPRQGRSGGGLFTADGYLVGVCSAADPYGNRGLFAALGAVQYLLSAAQLDHLYRDRSVPTEPQPSSPPVRFAHSERTESAAPPLSLPSPEELKVAAGSGASRVDEAPLERRSQSEPSGKREASAEIICVIRPLGGTNEPSRILVLRKADPKLIRLLEAHARAGSSASSPQLPSVNIPTGGTAIPASFTRRVLEPEGNAHASPWRPARRPVPRPRLLVPEL